MYKLTAPVKGFTGTIGPVAFANGTATTDNEAVIAFARRRGYGVEEVVDASPEETPDENQGGAAAETEQPAARPVKSASKEAWKAYAISQGMSEEDAETATRDALAEHYAPKDGGDA